MANTLMVNVPDDFDIEKFGTELSEMYQAKGFTVQVMKMKNGVRLKFDKKTGGINMLLGLGLGVTATCSLQGNGNLIVNYSDADWTGKIIGLAVGWFLCLVPFITAIIGCLKQSSLTKEIDNDIMMLVNQ